jgi:hypothetical protein
MKYAVAIGLVGIALVAWFVPAAAVVHLLGGWAFFLGRVVPRVVVRWEMLLTSFAYFVAFVLGAHLFMRWLWRESRKDAPAALRVWRMRWTVCGAAGFLLLFVIGTAAAGLVDQASRLAASPEKFWDPRK